MLISLLDLDVFSYIHKFSATDISRKGRLNKIPACSMWSKGFLALWIRLGLPENGVDHIRLEWQITVTYEKSISPLETS
jgi:hypothetical protein